jgi:hypothetical protein
MQRRPAAQHATEAYEQEKEKKTSEKYLRAGESNV